MRKTKAVRAMIRRKETSGQLLTRAHAPERPPVIRVAQQNDEDPDAVHPIGAHPAPFLDQPRHAGHELSHRDAEDDGVKDRDEFKRAHRASEDFSATAGNDETGGRRPLHPPRETRDHGDELGGFDRLRDMHVETGQHRPLAIF